LLSSPDTPLVLVYDVPSSPPAHSRGAARCIALPRSASSCRIINLQCLDLGGKGRTPGVDTHIVAIDEAGAIVSFDLGDWAADARSAMDIEDDQVMGKRHPEPIWDSTIRNMADGNTDNQSARPWAEKAKTKHKVLDLREIWLGTSDRLAFANSDQISTGMSRITIPSSAFRQWSSISEKETPLWIILLHCQLHYRIS
jgi:hypothetical protein